MQKLIVEIKNYKKIENLEAEFEAGNIYLVKAGNMKGKTSFTQALQTLLKAENKNDKVLTTGEKEGAVIGQFTGADGDIYRIQFEYSEGKPDKFLLVKPDTSTSRKVTDIRDIFKYNAFTAEEFFSWGLTEPGRKKQAQIILNLISEEARKKITVIDSKINEKDGSIYIQRKDANLAMDGFIKAADSIQLTPQEEKALKNGEAAKKVLEEYKDKLAKSGNTEVFSKRLEAVNKELEEIPVSIETLKTATENSAKDIKQEIADLEAKIVVLKEKGKKQLEDYNKFKDEKLTKIITLETEKKQLELASGSGEDVSKLKEDIERGEKFMEVYNAANAKKLQKEQNNKMAEDKKQIWTKLNDQINILRKERQDIFIEEKLPIENIYVEEDGLYFVKDGTNLPFSENNISYAEGGLIAAQIVCELNKKTPIICIGKASEYDSISKAKLADMAKNYNAIMFLDSVSETPEELHIEAYVNENK